MEDMEPSGDGQPAYGDLLRLRELLDAACVHDENVDQVLFLTTHQVCELWFAVLLRHLDAARAALGSGDGETAARRLEQLPPVIRVLIDQFDVLATLEPQAFEEIRVEVGDASGFQSVQYRELEFLCGQKDTRLLATKGFTEEDRARLRRRLEEPSVADAFAEFARGGAEEPATPRRSPAVAERVRRALLALDEAVVIWRARHAVLAERFLGGRPGTAGSAGARYLWRVTERRLFPDAWPQS
ncbi:tryptophan 2,3-dioxygenase family protein [Streptomyces sp. AC550_RSS872]|uniref:tryptophan 2,3-dioxygenase family protein n=1 Tax=Streptomyces sp. AC550_RSS872 TaxID=2823689 RepID=UPI001C25F022|nr:tryptophan 2,3-dioxygenase family protein [Streptomyces sp. AC550_RSS872]